MKATLALLTCIVLAGVLTACDAPQQEPVTLVENPGALTAEDLLGGNPETLAPETRALLGRQMSLTEHELVLEISERWGDDRRFGGFQWVGESRRLTLWWHGDLPDPLAEQLVDADVVVSVPERLPGEVQDAVHRLMERRTVLGARLTSAGAAIDGSGIDVTYQAGMFSVDEDELRIELERIAGVPIRSVDTASYMAISG